MSRDSDEPRPITAVSDRELASQFDNSTATDYDRVEQIESITHALLAMSAFDFSSYIPLRNADDSIEDLAVAARVAQRELRNTAVSAVHLQTLMSSMPNPCLLLDLDGGVMDSNDATRLLLGIGPGTNFTTWLQTYLGDRIPTDLCEWQTSIRVPCILDDGIHHFMFSSAPMRSHFDDIEGYVIVGTDITEQVETEWRLEHARRTAEAQADARFSFLANVSHDIRTPLNGILGLTELMSTADLDSELREQVDMIHSCGQHLLGLINDVLEFSRIDANRLNLDNQPVDLKSLLAACMSSLSASHVQNDVSLKAIIPDDLPSPLSCDPTRLRQLVFNLLGNALKFTTTGSVTLLVELLDVTPDDAEVRICVNDTGAGIEASKLETLFEPFVQAGPTSRFRGTGLGLSIVKRLVSLMGGTLGVESVVGEGSRFWFTIRLIRAQTPLPQRNVQDTDSERSAGELSYEKLHGANILVVEDELVNRKVVVRFLERMGAITTQARHGAEALALLNQRDFDAVVMDCQMPVMDGLSAVRAIRQRERDEQLERIPVIALTAHAFEAHRLQCLEAGMDDYLRKPIRRDELYRCLMTLLPPSP